MTRYTLHSTWQLLTFFCDTFCRVRIESLCRREVFYLFSTSISKASSFRYVAPPGWLSGERVGLMTWWLWVRSPVEATFLPGVFSPLTSTEACEKSSRWLWKEELCKYWCEKARKHICVTDRHDMTLAVKVALNPNTTNQPTNQPTFKYVQSMDHVKYGQTCQQCFCLFYKLIRG